MIMIAGAGRARAGLPRPPVSGPRSKAKLSSRTRRTGILDCRGPGTDSEDSDAASRRCPQTPEAGASRRAGSRPRQAAPPAENHVPAFAKGAPRLCGAAGFAVREKSTTVPSAWPSPVEAAGVGLAEFGIRPRLGHAVVRLGAPAIQRFGTRRRAQLRLHRRAEGAVSLR